MDQNLNYKKMEQNASDISSGSADQQQQQQQQNNGNGVHDNNDTEKIDEDNDDEFCIYTYKGGDSLADLPSSFFKFDSSDVICNHHQNNMSSSNNVNCSSSVKNPASSGSGSDHESVFSRPNSIHNSHQQPCSSHSQVIGLASARIPKSNRSTPPNNNGIRLNGQNNISPLANSSNNTNGGDLYSPEMDFLEMDFDPGGGTESEIEYDTMSPGSEERVDFYNNNEDLDNTMPLIRNDSNNDAQNKDNCNITSSMTMTNEETNHNRNNSNSPKPGCSYSSTTTGANDSSISGSATTSLNLNNSSITKPKPMQLSLDSPSPSKVKQFSTSYLNLDKKEKADNDDKKSKSSPLSTIEDDLSLLLNSKQNSSSSSSASASKRLSNSISLYPSLTRGQMSPLTEQHQITLRLVKSKTSPELSSNKPSTSTGSTSSSFLPTKTTPGAISSLSDPLIQIEPHFKAIINSDLNLNNDTVELDVGGVMIWGINEAIDKCTFQIGKSACGSTALINVLSVLGTEEISKEFVNECVGTRLRAEDGDLADYLFSRSNAGATHKDLILGIERAFNNKIYARFFKPKPGISIDVFAKFIFRWVCKGAVPVLTRNLQIQSSNFPEDEIPDAWHHQMVFGISPNGLFLSNPIELVSASELLPQLTSSSELLVKRQDIIKRFSPKSDIRKLVRNPDPRWNQMNVLGQVANILLEENEKSSIAKRVRTPHVKIPADYVSGVTLFILKDSPAYTLLLDTPELGT